MRRHDKRTREQRKADESALFAAACLGATVILIVISILATSAQAVEAPEESPEAVEEYDPAWDIPATESAVCNDVFLGEYTITQLIVRVPAAAAYGLMATPRPARWRPRAARLPLTRR